MELVFGDFIEILDGVVQSASGISGIAIEDEGVPKGTANTIDFVGDGVSASAVVGGEVTINIPGPDADRVALQGFRDFMDAAARVYFEGMSGTNGIKRLFDGTVANITFKNDNVITRALKIFTWDGATLTQIFSGSISGASEYSNAAVGADYDAGDLLIVALEAGTGDAANANFVMECIRR